MIETRSATIEDAQRISALLMANASDRGGALYGDWSIGVVTKWITDGALIIVAMDGPNSLGYCLRLKRRRHRPCQWSRC